jgi:hypothetical protein
VSEQLRIAVEKLSPKSGDVLVLRPPSDDHAVRIATLDAAEGVAAWLRSRDLDVLVFVGSAASPELFEEAAMAAAGWERTSPPADRQGFGLLPVDGGEEPEPQYGPSPLAKAYPAFKMYQAMLDAYDRTIGRAILSGADEHARIDVKLSPPAEPECDEPVVREAKPE